MLKGKLKDWQIAQMILGRNLKKDCKMIKELRKYGEIEYLCEGWSVITDSRLKDDCGWLIPNNVIQRSNKQTK